MNNNYMPCHTADTALPKHAVCSSEGPRHHNNADKQVTLV